MQPDVVEIDLEKESLSSIEQRKILAASPRSRRKFTYQPLKGKSLVRNLDWKAMAMSSFDFKDDPFQQIGEEMDQL